MKAETTSEEVRELRALVEELRAETRRLGKIVETRETGNPEPDGSNGPNPKGPTELITDLGEHRRSRRNMFKAGAAVAAAAVATPMLAKTAAAADGGNFVIGANNISGGGNTRLNATGAGRYNGQNILTVSDQSASSSFPAAIGAYAEGDRVTNGLYAYADTRDDLDTDTGYALVLRATGGGRAAIYMQSGGFTPTSDNYSHQRGELKHVGGDLWFCVSSGTPGTWRKLAGFNSAGAVHAISPRRAYDSRFIDGVLPPGGSRLVSVANGIDVNTGSSTGTLVPANATAVMFNIAVVNTTGVGFMSVNPGFATSFQSATINWSGAGQVLNNGSMSTIDSDRQIRVFGGGGSADFIIDITGYTL